MSEEPAPSPGQAIAGLFFIFSGGCLSLLGGGCTLITLSWIFSPSGGATDALELAVIAVLMLVAGIGLISLGRSLMRGDRNPPR